MTYEELLNTAIPSKVTLPELAEKVSKEAGIKRSCAYMVLATAYDILEEEELEIDFGWESHE